MMEKMRREVKRVETDAILIVENEDGVNCVVLALIRIFYLYMN
jgi:hypothetical protein